jgi:hypothetical protein
MATAIAARRSRNRKCLVAAPRPSSIKDSTASLVAALRRERRFARNEHGESRDTIAVNHRCDRRLAGNAVYRQSIINPYPVPSRGGAA